MNLSYAVWRSKFWVRCRSVSHTCRHLPCLPSHCILYGRQLPCWPSTRSFIAWSCHCDLGRWETRFASLLSKRGAIAELLLLLDSGRRVKHTRMFVRQTTLGRKTIRTGIVMIFCMAAVAVLPGEFVTGKAEVTKHTSCSQRLPSPSFRTLSAIALKLDPRHN